MNRLCIALKTLFLTGRGFKKAVLSAMGGRRASESYLRYHPNNLRTEGFGPRGSKNRI